MSDVRLENGVAGSERWIERTVYSSARASIGDICAARCDGRRQAARHTAAVTHAAAARTATLSGGTWKSSDRIARPACHAPIQPNTVPPITRRSESEKN